MALFQAFREDTDAWLIPAMYCVVHNLRDVACRADDEARAAGRKSDVLENCGTQLQKCFSVAMQGTGAANAPAQAANALPLVCEGKPLQDDCWVHRHFDDHTLPPHEEQCSS